MKVLYGISSRNNDILRIGSALQAAGYGARCFSTDSYRSTSSYVMKKLDKMGLQSFRADWIRQRRQQLFQTVAEYQPDQLLFINFPEDILRPEDLQQLSSQMPVVVWFVDRVAGHAALQPYFPFFSRIFVFEKNDVDYLRKEYDAAAVYSPVGFNTAYQKTPVVLDKSWDVVFVGSPFKNRLELLNQVAVYGQKTRLRMCFCGVFYETRYFWKKYLFQRQYPLLGPYAVNGEISSEEAASLYAKARICLNIHGAGHKGMNPRTFEIMAVGAFELLDAREDYAGLIRPGVDCAVFRDADELVHQIDYYLHHEDERVRIAASGRDFTADGLSMTACLQHVLQV